MIWKEENSESSEGMGEEIYKREKEEERQKERDGTGEEREGSERRLIVLGKQ